MVATEVGYLIGQVLGYGMYALFLALFVWIGVWLWRRKDERAPVGAED